MAELEPGGVAAKHRGLWSPRREFESLPGYHGFMEPNFIIPEDYDSSFNKPQTNLITLEELKQQAEKIILNQYDVVISLGGKNTQER